MEPSFEEIKYRRKIAKPELPQKESRRKASTTHLFCITRKMDKKYHIHQNYNVFVHKLTKSSHFLLSNFNRNSIFTRLFLSDMAIHKLDLGEFDKVDYNLIAIHTP
jgi:hypothetical protein